MLNWKELYKEIKHKPWLLAFFCASLIVIAVCAIKLLATIIVAFIVLLTTTSGLSVALFAIGYVVVKGVYTLYKENTDPMR